MQLDKYLSSTYSANSSSASQQMMSGMLKKLTESKEAQRFDTLIGSVQDSSPGAVKNNLVGFTREASLDFMASRFSTFKTIV